MGFEGIRKGLELVEWQGSWCLIFHANPKAEIKSAKFGGKSQDRNPHVLRSPEPVNLNLTHPS